MSRGHVSRSGLTVMSRVHVSRSYLAVVSRSHVPRSLSALIYALMCLVNLTSMLAVVAIVTIVVLCTCSFLLCGGSFCWCFVGIICALGWYVAVVLCSGALCWCFVVVVFESSVRLSCVVPLCECSL